MQKKRGLYLLGVLAVSLSLAGCGENLFGGESALETDNVATLLDFAKSPADYNKVVSLSSDVISNERSEPEAVQEAYSAKAAALSANSGVGVMDMGQDMLEYVDNADQADSGNFIESTSQVVESAESEVLGEIAASSTMVMHMDILTGSSSSVSSGIGLRSVEATGDVGSVQIVVSGQTITLTDTQLGCGYGEASFSNVSADEFLQTAIANSMVVVKRLSSVMDIAADNSVTFTGTVAKGEIYTLVEEIMAPLNNVQGSDKVSEWITSADVTLMEAMDLLDYANCAIVGFERSNSFTSEQTKYFEIIKNVATQVNALSTAVKKTTDCATGIGSPCGTGVYTVPGGVSREFNKLQYPDSGVINDAEALDDLMENAFKDIFDFAQAQVDDL
ncbi:MAG: hypothetical protein CL521_04655 [Actinobacteria bacterium]|nr:hypothetical protein [Actinomycetota bacterium]